MSDKIRGRTKYAAILDVNYSGWTTEKWVFNPEIKIDITAGSLTVSTKDWVWPDDAEIDAAVQPIVAVPDFIDNYPCAIAAYFLANPKETSVCLSCFCPRCTPWCNSY